MSEPSRKERASLTRRLKEFSRHESPMFMDGTIDAMKTQQTYMFFDRTPPDIDISGQLDFDETTVTLGYYATRFMRDDGKKPDYMFQVWMTASRLLHPRQLELTDDSWERLQYAYIDEDMSGYVEDGDQIEGVEPLEADEIRDEVVAEIIEASDTCESYQNIALTFSTAEPGIYSSYERGFKIGDTAYDVLATDETEMDDGWEAVDTADGDTHYIPPKLHPDELHIADEIDTRLRFIDIIRGVGLDNEASMNLLTPHEDKAKQMLFLVECMRRRRIDVG